MEKQTKGGFIMARQKDENRKKAMQLFLDSDGLMNNKEIATALNIDSAKVSKWKCIDKWKEALENKPKKKGAPRRNKNAKGHGAPRRNKNAEKHGAYSTIYFDELTEDEKALIESITLNSEDNMLRELQVLIVKEKDLQKRIEAYNNDDVGQLYIDKSVEIHKPNDKSKEDSTHTFNMVMETKVKSSTFERVMKLEAELNKVHGRIIKLLDSIKSYELEKCRIALEKKRYTLLKQKISGEYSVDINTGEIDDTYIEQEEELEEL